jgi:nicotinamide riboside transporter PnuC
LNSQMKVSGFYFWLVSNTGFMLINWYNCVYSQVALFLINNIVCVIGIVSWGKKVKK